MAPPKPYLMKLDRLALRQVFEVDRGGNQPLLFLEGLRGFAMLNIFLIHYISNFYYWLPQDTLSFRWSSAEYTIAHSSVDLFFLISGYLTYRTFIQRPRPFLPYLVRRTQRIYPVFLVVYGVYIALSFAAPSVNKIPGQPGEAFLYLLANLLLLPGLFPIQPMISVAWALSYEFFSYLAIPPITAVLRAQPSSRRMLVQVLLAAALIAGYLQSELVPVRMSAFLAGMLVYDLQLSGRTGKLRRGAGLAALAGLYIVIWLLPVSIPGLAGRAVVNFIGLSLLVCEPLDQPQGPTARLFSWTPLRWFGNISYSYFLVHGLVIRIGSYLLSRVYPPAPAPVGLFWLGMAISFPLTIAAALALYLLVERRFSLAVRPAAQRAAPLQE